MRSLHSYASETFSAEFFITASVCLQTLALRKANAQRPAESFGFVAKLSAI